MLGPSSGEIRHYHRGRGGGGGVGSGSVAWGAFVGETSHSSSAVSNSAPPTAFWGQTGPIKPNPIDVELLSQWDSVSLVPDISVTSNSELDSSGLAGMLETFPCDVCDKIFTNKLSYMNHSQVHSGKVYRCEVCHKIFNHPNNFRQHKRVVHGEKRFECPVCHWKFSTKQNCRSHIHNVHPDFKLSDFGQSYIVGRGSGNLPADSSQSESSSLDS